jgi:hypothetical protein
MKKTHWYGVALIAAVVGIGVVYAQQYPLIDRISNELIQKYQSASCEQLWQQKGQPKTERQKEFVQLLRDDPQARTYFINQVAAPIVNKMFDCALIP